jgi:hypothetical protein
MPSFYQILFGYSNQEELDGLGNVPRVGDRLGAYKILLGNRALGRTRYRWNNNIKTDI